MKPTHGKSLPHDVQFRVQFDKELLGGTPVITASAERASHEDWRGRLYKADTDIEKHLIKVKFIPYYVWANWEPAR